jgi:hypothetical protein
MQTTNDDIPESVWEGTFSLFGVDVRCHILGDGGRIIEAESMRDLFEAMSTAKPDVQVKLDGFIRWMNGMDQQAEAMR